MTLLPLAPLLASAFVSVAMIASPGPSSAAGHPVLHRTAADIGWQDLLIDGPGPVFRHPDRPLRA